MCPPHFGRTARGATTSLSACGYPTVAETRLALVPPPRESRSAALEECSSQI
eukprot:m.472992 g.472992  ORF g.472992 m.472992 type:complete len:52 (+) comp33608_c0_seq1:329-484(+)